MHSTNNHSKAVATASPERKTRAHSRVSGVESPDKALARRMMARLNAEELKRKSTVGLYCLKAKDGQFGLPYCAVSEHFALLAQKEICPLTDCYKVGTICLYDGKLTPIKPFVVLDKGVDHD